MLISAFECWVPNAPWGKDVRTVINAQSHGKARMHYWRHVTDAWPEIPFTAVRVRRLGAPQSSPEFLIGVGYRGIPHVRCGDRVTWKNGGGNHRRLWRRWCVAGNRGRPRLARLCASGRVPVAAAS